MRAYGVPIRASSEAITMSAPSAISLPPPMHQPWICAITGLGLRHMLMNFWVGDSEGVVAMTKSLPASHCPSVASGASQCLNPPLKS